MLIATYLIEIFRKEGMIFEDYLKDVNSYFTRNVNLPIKNKRDIIRNEIIKNKIFEIKNKLNKDCKVVVRPSGTEDLVRITLMAKDEQKVTYYTNELVELIKEIEQ